MGDGHIFSFIKCFQKHKNFVLPDKLQMNDTIFQLFVLLVKIYYMGVMGGMAAQIQKETKRQINRQSKK